MNTLPETLADSTITSLSDLVGSIPDSALDDQRIALMASAARIHSTTAAAGPALPAPPMAHKGGRGEMVVWGVHSQGGA